MPDAPQPTTAQGALPREIRVQDGHGLLGQMRQRHSIRRQAGSVHGCAWFAGSRMPVVVDHVGRHNAIDTIAGWRSLHGVAGADETFYSTGRLTSEMVMKSAHMGVPITVSRNGGAAQHCTGGVARAPARRAAGLRK